MCSVLCNGKNSSSAHSNGEQTELMRVLQGMNTPVEEGLQRAAEGGRKQDTSQGFPASHPDHRVLCTIQIHHLPLLNETLPPSWAKEPGFCMVFRFP